MTDRGADLSHHLRDGISDEANFSAESNSAKADPRLPGPHEDEGWPRHPQAAAREGPEAARSHRRVEVAVGSESPGRTFGRVDRLRSSREFQHVSRRGQRASSSGFVVIAAPRRDQTHAGRGRIGLTVSRRVGGAVDRNRVKRRLREWFRRSATRTAGAIDWVVIARPGVAMLPSEAVAAELDGLCGRLLAEASS